ncbi:MAG TPA: c-type cytochrome [Candidatus Polarisedimenticolaceae bacterium]|nr:c-type cytochrome [Candidatus Polarisedimenticolaceae bacterium]
MRRLLPFAACLGVSAVLAQAPPAEPKTEEHYKNIQVLKGYPADQLVPTMQFISSSLDVDCDYCHVERAPEKDDKKEKQTARKMIAMTLGINRDTFGGKREVTCYSCHRGTTHPLATPLVAERDEPQAAAAAPAAAPPAAEPVLEHYLQAVGGAEALAKVETRIGKGTLTGLAPDPLPVEVYAKAPDKRVSIVHTARGESITAFDGKGGWLGNPGRPAREMTAAESEAAHLDAYFRFPAQLKQLFSEFRVRPAEKLDGHDVVHVVARNEGRPPVDLYFDAQSGLLLRLVRYAETLLGRNPTEVDYADYREADGVKLPFRWTIARPNGRFTIQLESVQHNAPIDDARFNRPPQAPS